LLLLVVGVVDMTQGVAAVPVDTEHLSGLMVVVHLLILL
jgi:hypothetical protein